MITYFNLKDSNNLKMKKVTFNHTLFIQNNDNNLTLSDKIKMTYDSIKNDYNDDEIQTITIGSNFPCITNTFVSMTH